MQMQQTRLPPQRLTARFAATEPNDERIVPVTFYSGATVLQFNWENGAHNLRLSMEPAHIRLEALKSGTAPFTKGHSGSNNPEAVIGVIAGARIEGGKAHADVRFSKRADVEPLYSDVLDGILQNVSVEARLYKLKEVTADGDKLKTFLATDWEPHAVALVAQGADPGAHINNASVELSECEIETRATARQGDHMEETTTQGQVANPDSEWIRRVAKLNNLVAFGEDLIARNMGKERPVLLSSTG